MDNRLFRKRALENITSPEDLEVLIRVTSPRNWIALLAVAGLILCLIIWSFFGSLHETIEGHGILVREGGIRRVTAPSGGKVISIEVRPGSFVSSGTIIAHVEQPDLEAEYTALALQKQALEEDLKEILAFHKVEAEMASSRESEERALLLQSDHYHREHLDALQERLASQKTLLADGLIIKDTLLMTEVEIADEELALMENNNLRLQLSMLYLRQANERKADENNLRHQISLLDKRLEAAGKRLSLNSQIPAPFSGTVLEVTAHAGELVKPGQPIALMELGSADESSLRLIAFIPAVDAKRIQGGMTAHLAPSTVRKEEFGQVLGTIDWISEFPATMEGIMSTLNNTTLTETMLSQGAVIQTIATLQEDPDTFSGYAWTSSKGAPVMLQSGTLCDVSIIAVTRRPASLFLPFLKEKFFGK